MLEDMKRRLHESPEYRQEQLSAALDGMLSHGEQAALDAHLAGCRACSRELEDLRQVRMRLRAMPRPALPRSFTLPVGGEMAASRTATRAPGPRREAQPAAHVTPLRPLAQRAPRNSSGAAARTLRVTRWIGTIAAVLGLALFLGSVLPMITQQPNNFGASAPASSMDNGSQRSASGNPSGTLATNPAPTRTFPGGPNTDKAATATVTPTLPAIGSGSTATVTMPRTNDRATSGPSLAEILRTISLVLIVAGAALALLAYLVARQL